MKKNKVMDEVLGDTPELTASDLYSTDFRTAFRGYDKAQVTAFLERAADAFEALQHQIEELKKTAADQKEQIATYQEMERALSEALSDAQRLNETTRDQARREADLIRREAEQVRETAHRNAQQAPERLRAEINHLKAMRTRLQADLRAVLDIHRALLQGGASENDAAEYLPADSAAYITGDDDDPATGDIEIAGSEVENGAARLKDDP